MNNRVMKMGEYPLSILTGEDQFTLRYQMPRCVEDEYGFMLVVRPPAILAEARREVMEDMSHGFTQVMEEAAWVGYDWVRFDEDAPGGS